MKKGYPLIDKMRIVAAILVVGIHIYPFKNISPVLDFILTRILGRLAVPFFFMVTAYFLFQDGYPSHEKIKKTLFDLGKWYMISAIIYLPILIYNGYLTRPHLFFEILKDIFIDGLFYHLWYFPAVMIGLIIVLYLLKYFKKSQVFYITTGLYLIGLCGDSYYQLVIHLPILKNVLSWLFQLMDYSRNGFFFAPLFIVLGIFASQEQPISKQKHGLILLLALFLMTVETTCIHTFQLFKHDSMTFSLPFVSYYLLTLLVKVKGKRYRRLKDLSLYIYIIHPLMIIIVKEISQIMKMNWLFSNNLIQFMIVLLLTLLSFYIIQVFLQEVKKHERIL